MLKTSSNPSDASLTFEYLNLINKRIWDIIIQFHRKLYKKSRCTRFVFQAELESIVENYEDALNKSKQVLGTGSVKDVYESIESINKKLIVLYKNILLSKYNNVFTQSDYYFEFLNSINYLISVHPRLGDSAVDEDVINFYKTVLISLFDVDYLNSLYVDRFDTYLNNYINFGEGEKYPLISVTPTLENQNDEQKHQPCILKLFEPLPTNIAIGQKLYLSSSIYSDDVMQNYFLKQTKYLLLN